MALFSLRPGGTRRTVRGGAAAPFVLSTKPRTSQDGSIAYASGRQGNIVPFEKADLLVDVKLHLQGTMTFTQPAGAAAPSFSQGTAHSIFGQVMTMVGGAGPVINATGRSLYLLELAKHPAYVDSSSKAPLPPANGGGAQVVTQEAWDLWLDLPIAVSLNDLTGLLSLQERVGAVQQQLVWSTESGILNLPNATTAAFAGQATLDVRRYLIPADPRSWPDLGWVHIVEELVQPIVAGGVATRVNLPPGDEYLRIILEPNSAGAPDATNALGFSLVNLNYGGFQQEYRSAENLQFESQLHDRQNLPASAYILDYNRDAPRDRLNTAGQTQINLDLTFANVPPANSFVRVLTERLRRVG